MQQTWLNLKYTVIFALAIYMKLKYHRIQFCSVITRGRVLTGERTAQRFQKLIYLHLFNDYRMKVSNRSQE